MSLVIDSCRIAVANPKASQDFFHILGAAIATLYASSFTEGNGLGTLDKKYSTFPDAIQKGMHEDLMRARHAIFAHKDLIDNPNNIHDIEIRILPHGKLHVQTPVAGYLLEDYERIAIFADFQKTRFEIAAEKTSIRTAITAQKASRTIHPWEDISLINTAPCLQRASWLLKGKMTKCNSPVFLSARPTGFREAFIQTITIVIALASLVRIAFPQQWRLSPVTGRHVIDD